jgi:hypothetical protein
MLRVLTEFFRTIPIKEFETKQKQLLIKDKPA